KRQTGRDVKTAQLIDLEVARQNLGNLYWEQKETDAALQLLNEARTELEGLVRDFPKRLYYQKKLAVTYNSLGSALSDDKAKWSSAEDDWHRARDILLRLVNEEPKSAPFRHELGRVLGNLGWLVSEKGDWKEARTLFERAVEHLQEALKL